MISKDKEKVLFPGIFEMRGAVEIWLNDLVSYMQSILRHILVDTISETALWEVNKPREEWIFAYPAQLCLAASQIT